MKLILVTVLIAALGCEAQYPPSSPSRHRSRGSSAERNDAANSRRALPQSAEEMSGSSMYHNCFVQKGCFGLPAGCVQKQDCQVLLTFSQGEGGIVYHMSGYLEQDQYMAMGFSMDSQMGEDAVTECFRQGGSDVLVRESWNSGKSNTDTVELPRHVYHAEYKDGLTNCAWQEDYIKETNGMRFNLQNNTYYLILAKGPMRNGRIGYHSSRLASQEAVNFTAFDTISGDGVTDSVKIHGTFMITGWLGFVSVAILLARHFKSAWENKTMCGVKIWFALHRGLMIAGLLFIAVSFITIFIHKNGWNYGTSNPHAILGCIATALGLFQPIMALFRPSPDDSKRPIFNWLHFAVGNSAQLLAVITMFYAVSLESSGLEDNFYWVLAIFVVVYLLFHFLFQMLSWTSGKKKNEVKMVEMSSRVGANVPNGVQEKNVGDSVFKVLLLGVYVIFLVAIILALYALIGVA